VPPARVNRPAARDAAAAASERAEFERVERLMAQVPRAVFVFGSNAAGVHGRGAAAFVARHYGAQAGVGEGLRGQSYALPTKRTWRDPLTWHEVEHAVARFLAFARSRPDLGFIVTRVGCGLAGYTDAQMAPLFASAPDNCALPIGWGD
jgi:protein-L-isoaspartate O-methyltransferase